MHGYVQRELGRKLEESLAQFPVTVLLGPRQCGKSTLARHLLAERSNTLLLDLERPSDLHKLDEPEFFLETNRSKLICIDEVQLLPELFPLLRSLVDADRRTGRFLILGSASQELIRQSSESLAGRVAYHELTPFLSTELSEVTEQVGLWIRGEFPDSVFAESSAASQEWREQFVRTFLERDLAQFNLRLHAPTMRRFWTMLAHYHGQTINYSKIAQSMDASHTTIKRWVEILEQTFMVRVLRPFSGNLKKRLIKAPKIYLRDSGVLHALLDIGEFDELMGNPIAGASWEGYALENILSHFPRCAASFYRSSNGEEIDLILERKGKRIGVEFKMSASPKLSKGSKGSMEALELDMLLVVIPSLSEAYMLRPKTKVCDIDHAIREIMELLHITTK